MLYKKIYSGVIINFIIILIIKRKKKTVKENNEEGHVTVEDLGLAMKIDKLKL